MKAAYVRDSEGSLISKRIILCVESCLCGAVRIFYILCDITITKEYIDNRRYFMKIGAVARARLEKNIGLTMEEVRAMSIEEQLSYIERKTGAPMSFVSVDNPTKRARGNVALGRNRFRTIEQVNCHIDALLAARAAEKRS